MVKDLLERPNWLTRNLLIAKFALRLLDSKRTGTTKKQEGKRQGKEQTKRSSVRDFLSAVHVTVLSDALCERQCSILKESIKETEKEKGSKYILIRI